MRDYNRQYFSKDDIKAGLHIKFIQFLFDQYGAELKDETSIPRIETVTEQN